MEYNVCGLQIQINCLSLQFARRRRLPSWSASSRVYIPCWSSLTKTSRYRWVLCSLYTTQARLENNFCFGSRVSEHLLIPHIHGELILFFSRKYIFMRFSVDHLRVYIFHREIFRRTMRKRAFSVYGDFNLHRTIKLSAQGIAIFSVLCRCYTWDLKKVRKSFLHIDSQIYACFISRIWSWKQNLRLGI